MITDFDIQSHDLYVHGPPFERFDELRREHPVFRHQGVNEREIEWFWALTRHADIVNVSRQWQTYSSGREGALMMAERPEMDLARMMIDMDPPEHSRVRGLVDRGFTPKAIRLLADHYVEVTRELVGEAVAAREVEFVTAVASELPLIAISEMLGIPAEDRGKVFDWSNRMIGATDPDYSGGIDDAAAASMVLYMYAQELAADRRHNPRDDIISILVSEHDGDILSEHEFNVFALLLPVAGNETTRKADQGGRLGRDVLRRSEP